MLMCHKISSLLKQKMSYDTVLIEIIGIETSSLTVVITAVVATIYVAVV